MARPRQLRLFVAIYPTPQIVEHVHAAIAGRDLPLHRRVPAEQVHVTVQFIGEIPPTDVEATLESVRRSASGLGGFELTLQRLISLPERGPARLIAAETDAPPTLLEIKRRLVTRLARHPRRDERRFRPHLTMLRYRRPVRQGRLDAPVALAPESFAVSRLSVMTSTLHPTGARHDLLEHVELAGP